MKDCHALCVAVGPNELARLLGYESMFHFPQGVHLMPVRVEHGVACFDFVSDEPFKIGEMESRAVLPAHPLPHGDPAPRPEKP